MKPLLITGVTVLVAVLIANAIDAHFEISKGMAKKH